MPNGARAARHQHPAPLHRPAGANGAMRGHTGYSERRALRETHSFRQLTNEVDIKLDVVARRAERAPVALAVVEPHALAEPSLRHVWAERFYDTRAIAVRDHTRILHR